MKITVKFFNFIVYRTFSLFEGFSTLVDNVHLSYISTLVKREGVVRREVFAKDEKRELTIKISSQI